MNLEYRTDKINFVTMIEEAYGESEVSSHFVG
jgi:hypothetical protein